MPRPSNTNERRQQITRGLMTAMATGGYGGATVQEIARTAKLTPGVVHYHFGSKQAILLALVEQLAATTDARLQKRLEDSQTPRDRLLAFIDAHVALDDDADPSAVACWVQIGAEALRQPEVCEVYESIVEQELSLLRALVIAALDEVGQPTDDGAEMAAALYSAIQGAYQLAVATDALPQGFASPMLQRIVDGFLLPKEAP